MQIIILQISKLFVQLTKNIINYHIAADKVPTPYINDVTLEIVVN